MYFLPMCFFIVHTVFFCLGYPVVGYDGTTMMRNVLPNLTTIVQPIEEIATTAMQVLQKRMNQEATDPEYILPVMLWPGATGKKDNDSN